MSFIKKYDVGSAALDLPYQNLVYNKHIVGFKYRMQEINLDLVYNSGLGNVFGFRSGVKLNLQKKLNTTVVSNVTIPTSLIDSNGRTITLTGDNGSYITTDGSGRIVRAISNVDEKFELSDLAGNRETFDQNGKILNVYDKYNSTPLLSYFYSSGVLHAIVCPDYRGFVFEVVGNTTSILFLKHITVSGQTITYQSTDIVCTSTLNYSNGLTVGHYLGASLVFTFGTGRNLTVQSKAGTTVKEELTSAVSGTTVTITSNIDGVTKAKNIYTQLLVKNSKYELVDVKDLHGVNKRMEFDGDDLVSTYEIVQNDEDSTFVYGAYGAVVSMFNRNNEFGKFGYAQGTSFNRTTSTYMKWLLDHDNYNVNTLEGNLHYVFSGWIKPLNSSCGAITIEIYKDSWTNTPIATKTITDTPVGHWRYVFVDFVLPSASAGAYAFIQKTDSVLSVADVRLHRGDNFSGVVDEYFKYNGSEHKFDEIASYKYTRNGSTVEAVNDPNNPICLDDILAYIANQARGIHTNEVYYDRMKKIIDGATNLQLSIDGINYFAVSNATYIKKTVCGLQTTKTEYSQGTSSEPFSIEITQIKVIIEGNTLHTYTNTASQTVNAKLDVVSESKDGVLTTYTIDTAGRTTNVSMTADNKTISKQYSYLDSVGSYGYTILVTDENDEQSGSNADKIWGDVVRVVAPNGLIKTLTYSNYHESVIKVSFWDGTTTIENDITFADGYLSAVSHDSIDYAFSVASGELSGVTKESTALESIVYTNNFLTSTSTLPTASNASYTRKLVHNKYNQLTKYTQGASLNNSYWAMSTIDDNDEQCTSRPTLEGAVLAQSEDMAAMEKTEYGYNGGLLKKAVTYTDDSPRTKLRKEEFEYDTLGREKLCTFRYDVPNSKKRTTEFFYDDDHFDSRPQCSADTLYTTSNIPNCVMATAYEYDAFKRLSKKQTALNTAIYSRQYFYHTDGSATSNRLTRHKDGVKIGSTTTYKHDVTLSYDNGFIIGESDSIDTNDVSSYEYDGFGRLTREDNKKLNKTFLFSYDVRGNLTSVSTHAYTTGTPGTATSTKTYSYDTTHTDRLVTFNGSSVVYNQQGCPTSYLGKTIQWKWGRVFRLQTGNAIVGKESAYYYYNANGSLRQISYTYTAGGLPPVVYTTSKTIKYKYSQDGRLVNENIVNNYNTGSTDNVDMDYIYDESGVCGCRMTLNGAVANYFYARNAKGDVVEIYNSSGTCVVKYAYDAYGNCTVVSSSDANILAYNSIKYRGYYYDSVMGLYWLQTRYYDPNTGRFISPDATQYLDTDTVHGVNLYAYCGNCPTMFADPSGHTPRWLQIAGWVGLAVGIALCAVAIGILTAGVGSLAGTMAGAILYGAAKGALIGGAVGAGMGAISGGISSAIAGNSISSGAFWSDVAFGAMFGFGTGALTGAITGGINGAHGYSINSRYINQYGEDVKQVLSAFKGNPKLEYIGNSTITYRYWGGSSGIYGHWMSPIDYGAASRGMLALPVGNTMENLSTISIQYSYVLTGIAAPYDGLPGGGVQWWVGW